MFDPTTERLISSAPPLPPSEELGLGRVSPKELARELTAAFSEVSAARLRINSAASQPSDEAEVIGPIIRRLRRMAETYESLVCLGQGEVNQPAAFVAGVARQLIGEADAISRAEGLRSFLSDDAISSDV